MAKKEVIDNIRSCLKNSSNIRNISVIAHVDHGKSTLTDSLIVAAGLMSKGRRGDRFMDVRDDEKKRGITIKSTSVSMVFDVMPPKVKTLPKKGQWSKEKQKEKKEEKQEDEAKEEKTQPFLINLIDSPGHVDFSSEVTAALRVTDGALVVVDCVEGVCVQTETVLRQALAERIKPVLFVNKLDRIFTELHMESEDAYQGLLRSVESVNVVISSLPDSALGDVSVWPQNGTVGFGSGLQGWGFTIGQIAELYHNRFKIPKKKMMKKLWGDNFWDPKKEKWTTTQFSSSGKKLQRGFCMLVLDPIRKLFDAILKGEEATYQGFLAKQNIKLPKEAKDEKGSALLKTVMQTWLPASNALLEMIVTHLPSPITAQQYRVENLYSGPLDDDVANAIRRCDPEGPLVMYVSKMVPTVDKSRFYAFGRVFAGTIHSGQAVRIQGPDYCPGAKLDLSLGNIQGTVLMMGPYVENLGSFPCGTVCGVVGVDQYLLKSGTITTSPTAHNIVTMKFSVAPIVRVAVEVENPSHLAKLNVGLKRLAQSEQLVQTYLSPTGEHIVAGCGELHLQVCLRDLQEDFMKGCKLKVSNPVVTFRESVSEKSMVCISKSPNKLNRVHVSAQPLGDKLCQAIEAGNIVSIYHGGRGSTGTADGKEGKLGPLAMKKMTEEFKWSPGDTKKIWAFGLPPDSIANVLVDVTKGVQNLHESRELLCSAFQEATLSGVFAEEPIRGVRFNVEDVKLHADTTHRGPRQIVPAMKSAMYAAQMQATPILLEPVYQCDIAVTPVALAGVYSTLRARRAIIDGSPETNPKAAYIQVRSLLPVTESFGFTELLRKNTSGQAFPQMVFSHWQPVKGDLFDMSSPSHNLVMEIRKRKGLKLELPLFSDMNANDLAPPSKDRSK